MVAGHRSMVCAAQTFEACAMANPIEPRPPRRQEEAFTAGVLKPVIWGVRRGVGKSPRAGAWWPEAYTVAGDGSMIMGVW